MDKKLIVIIAVVSAFITICLSCINDPVDRENEETSANLSFDFSWPGDSSSPDAVEELHITITSNELSDTINGRFNFGESKGSFDKDIPTNIPITVTISAFSVEGELLYEGKTSISQTQTQTSVSFQFELVDPLGPASLKIPSQAEEYVSLEWEDRSSSEEGYIIFRSVAGKNQFTAIDTVASNGEEFVDTSGLQNAQIYQYRVFAFNAAGLSETYEEGEVHFGNWAPAFSPTAPLSSYQLRGNGDTLSFAVIADDPDSEQVQITFQVDTTVFPRYETITFDKDTFSWVSVPGDAGEYVITFTASDGTNEVTKEVALTISGVNLSPVVTIAGHENNQKVAVTEGKSLELQLQVSDPNEGQSASFTDIENAPWEDTLNGTGSFDLETGQFIFSPAFSAVSGQQSRMLDTVTITATDDHSSPARASVSFVIEIVDSNSAPVWVQTTAELSAVEKQRVTFNYAELFDADPEGDNVSFSANVGAVDEENGIWGYTPTFDDAGEMTVEITATDDHEPSESSVLTLSITVADSNRAPQFTAEKPQETYAVDGDGDVLTIITEAADEDDDDVALWYEVDTESFPRADEISFADNQLQWTSQLGDKGTFTVLFFASDGKDTTTREVMVSIAGANIRPEISIEGYTGNTISIKEGKTLSLQLIAEDRNSDQDVRFTGIENAPWEDPSNGSGSFDTSAGVLTFTPAFGVSDGIQDVTFDSVLVRAVDNHEEPLADTICFHIEVLDSNSAPRWSVESESVAGLEGEVITFALSDVLEGDAEGDEISLTSSKGSINQSTHEWSWEPGFNDSGVKEVVITAADNHVPSAESQLMLIVTVSNANRAPTSSDGSFTMDEDGVLDISLDADDADEDTLQYTIETDVRNGTLTAGATPGTYTYEPDRDFWGSDSFSFYVSDANASSDEAWVRIQVEGINDAPVAEDDSYTTSEGAQYTCSVLDNDSDVDGDDLTIEFVSAADHGSVDKSQDGKSIIYTPQAHYSGNDAFTYIVSDGNGETDQARVEITIDPVNDPPEFVMGDGVFEINEGDQFLDSIWATDIDGTTPAVSVVSISSDADDWLSVNPTLNKAIISATPTHDVSSGEPVIVTIKFSAYDGTNSVIDSVKIRVLNVNVLPQVRFEGIRNDDVFAVGKDVEINAAATDPDGQITCVKFFKNGQLLGIDSAAPYTSSIPAIAHNVYVLRARAYDNYGDSTSREIEIKTGRWIEHEIREAGDIIDYVVDNENNHLVLTIKDSVSRVYEVSETGQLLSAAPYADVQEYGKFDKLAVNPSTGMLYAAATKRGSFPGGTFEELSVYAYEDNTWSLVGDTFGENGISGSTHLPEVNIAFTPDGIPVIHYLYKATSDRYGGKRYLRILDNNVWAKMEPPLNDGRFVEVHNFKERLFTVVEKFDDGLYNYMYEYLSGEWQSIGLFNDQHDVDLGNLIVDHSDNLWVSFSRYSVSSHMGSLVKRFDGNEWQSIVVDTNDYTYLMPTMMMYDTTPLISLVHRNRYNQLELLIQSYKEGVLETFPINNDGLSYQYDWIAVIPGTTHGNAPSFLVRSDNYNSENLEADLYIFEEAY